MSGLNIVSMRKNRKWAFILVIITGVLLLALAARHVNIASFLHGITSVFSQRDKQFDTQDASQWPQSNLDWQTSQVDLSFLNANEKPAGRRGFVTASGESLVFGDGTTARFWGANIAARALFGTTKEHVKQQARRLSALGFNLVRIHHFDSPWVNPNIFGEDAVDTQALDASSMDKLDWWIKCLKEEGIYVWLDLHVQRAFTAKDNIYGFDEIRKNEKVADLKGYNYINPSIQSAMKRFNETYLNHVNKYTGVAYKNEPAIMALLITNENDITNHFGNFFLADKNVPLHNQIYMNLANKFAMQSNFPADKVWRSWELGAPKLFLNDVEHRFNIGMISHLRGLGAKVSIATTSIWGDDPLYSLPSLADGDIIDAHAYGEERELDKSPLAQSNMASWLSMAQVAGKPMSVTEWNVSPFPVADRHLSPLFIASAARQQGWDAVMLYAYAQGPLNDAGRPSNWQAFNDPALLATLPAAALLYRQGHVQEASTTYALTPDRAQLFYHVTSPETSIAARTAAEKGKLVVVMPEIAELPWLKKGQIPVGAKIIQNPNQSMLAEDATEAISDTGEIRHNWAKGIYTINTPLTQAAMGWIGKEQIVLQDVRFDIKIRNASVAVQSLDGVPIRQSSRLLISLGSQAVPSGDMLPFRAEPVLGQLIIHANKGLKLFKAALNDKDQEVPFDYRDGAYVINLAASLGAACLFLK